MHKYMYVDTDIFTYICIHYRSFRTLNAPPISLHTNIPIAENVADLATKILPVGQKRDYLVGKLLFDIVDCDNKNV